MTTNDMTGSPTMTGTPTTNSRANRIHRAPWSALVAAMMVPTVLTLSVVAAVPALAQSRDEYRDDRIAREPLPWQGGSQPVTTRDPYEVPDPTNPSSYNRDAYDPGSTKDGYPEPVPPPPTGYAPPPPPKVQHRSKAAACLSKPDLRLALKDQGWHNFDDVNYRDGAAIMTADNNRGRRFEVEFDACSGDVVEARPIVEHVPPPTVYYVDRPRPRWGAFHPYPRHFGPYAYGPRPHVGLHANRWRHDRHWSRHGDRRRDWR